MKLEELQQLKKEKEIRMGKIDQVVKEDKKLKKHAGILFQILNERTSIANELKVIDTAIKGKELNRELVEALKNTLKSINGVRSKSELMEDEIKRFGLDDYWELIEKAEGVE